MNIFTHTPILTSTKHCRVNRALYCIFTGIMLISGRYSFADTAPVPVKTYFSVAADPALKATLPRQILDKGYIAAATNPTTPPTVFFMNDNKTLAGREIDLMTAIGERLGIPVKWYNTGGFENIIPGLKTGRYDVVLSNIRATRKRFQQIDFVSYFDASRQAVISRKDSGIAPFTELSALCGKTVSTGEGTGQTELVAAQSKACVAAGKPAITDVIYPGRPAAIQAVLSGRVPMFYGPWEGLAWQVSQIPALTITGTLTVHEAPMSIGLPKNSPLEVPVQAALNSLIADGTYQKILDHWNVGYGAIKKAERNEAVF